MINKTKSLILASLALAGSLAAGVAQARSDVYWSIGINAPVHHGVTLGTVISNTPGYYGAPAYYAPSYYAPAPVYYAPRPVYVQPRPVYVQPRTVYVQPRWVPPGHAKRQHYHDRHDRWDRRDDRRDRRDWRDDDDRRGRR